MKKVGYCVTGLGVGMAHVKAAAANPNAELVAVCDLRDDRLQKVAADYPNVKLYKDFDEMLRDPAIDIVSIALPSAMHGEFAAKALDAGKNILSEKPIDITVERAMQIEEARIRSGKKAGVIFQNRNNPVMQEAKKAVESGKLGKLILGTFAVKWYRNQKYYDDGGWRGTWAMDGGGSLMNQAVHTVDLMQWLMGDVASVSGTYSINNHVIETEDLTASVIRFKNGATATFVSTTCCNPSRGTFVQLYGSDGTIEINEDRLEAWKFPNAPADEEAQMLEKYAKGTAGVVSSDPTLVTGHASQVNDIIDAVINDHDPQVMPKEAMKAVRIINAVYESSRTGKTIYFD